MHVLGLPPRHGPLPGNALRRMAYHDRTELPTEFMVGALPGTGRHLA
jgi:hypothetical protein